MSILREVAFDLLFNAALQIGLFALVAALFAPLVSRAKAKYQYLFYLGVFALSLTVPLVNTFRHAPAQVREPNSKALSVSAGQHAGRLWVLTGDFDPHKPITLPSSAKDTLLCVWALLILFQLVQFSRSLHRVHRLRRRASAINSPQIESAKSILDGSCRIVVLQSETIDDPVTVGIFHPAIILPAKVLPSLAEPDLQAIFAHEYGHIRRNDYALQLLSQAASLPVVWHPGIRFLLARLSQTRELACDGFAVLRLGKPLLYANTLLRLASLCLHLPRGNAMELGIFDGDNLEDRIDMLTQRKTLLSRAGVAVLALASIVLFGSGAMLAHAVSLQQQPASATDARSFVGTWHWMFDGHSFATMILAESSSGISGTVTGSKIKLDDDGSLSRADPTDQPPAPIARTSLQANALHVTVMDQGEPFEFLVTLKDPTHAEIHPIGAPANMKPIQAEKAN